MSVVHANTGKKIRLGNAQKLFGRDRETVDEAYPGDVVGLVSNAQFAIGDTLTENPAILYREIPRFPPECFAHLENPQPSNYKRFRDGLEQLLQEGVVQSFTPVKTSSMMHLLAAVGPLQFEIVQYRLESEYGAPSQLVPAPWSMVRWYRTRDGQGADLKLPSGVIEAEDRFGQRVLLFPNEWKLRYFTEDHPDIILSALPFDDVPSDAELVLA
jgi:peptide chain release factor 3